MLPAALLLVATAVVHAVVPWRDAPEYLALFAPESRRAAYRVAVSPAPLDRVLEDLSGDQALVRAPGSWEARRESAPDAFGTAGLVNRWLLARVYGGRQVRVARGARMARGRVVEAWTLISPYPSPDLRTLQPGTLRLVLEIEP